MKKNYKLIRILLILVLSNLSLITLAQITERTNRIISIPDIPGFKTLKCDFHMHTVFSDGHVWPSFRVNEAIRDGLDVISLTEHIDYEGFPEVVARNYNQSYDLAVEAAKNKNLMIIKGLEISPRVPPYHNNALFIKDANILPTDYMKDWKKKFIMKDTITHDQLLAPFLEAKRQDAFVFYNHPGYSWWDKKDTAIFTSFHKELLERKILKGVEVVNSGVYNILAHRLAMKYNLTMVCNTDEHFDNSPRYAKTHRPMTLVFAKEKSPESLKEAMLAGRTALYFDDYLIAREREADALFKAAVQISTERKLRNGEPILNIQLFNNSDIPFKIQASADFDIERYPFGQVTLAAHDTTTITLKALWKYPESTPLRIKVLNLITAPDEVYQTVFKLSTEEKKK